jgi:hypothetical protein
VSWQIIIITITALIFIGTLLINPHKIMNSWTKAKLNINGIIKASWIKKHPCGKTEYYTVTGTKIDLEENIVTVVEECSKSHLENDIPPNV